jgi:hypothetical protein
MIKLKSEENPSILYIDNCKSSNCYCENDLWYFYFDSTKGYNYFFDLERQKYNKKKLGYIIENLEQKYRLLEHNSGNTYDKFKPSDWFYRISFTFLYMLDNYNLLVAEGCININNALSIENEIEALDFLKEQEEYFVYFYRIDLKAYYKNIQKHLYTIKKPSITHIELIKEYFPHIIQEYEENNNE